MRLSLFVLSFASSLLFLFLFGLLFAFVSGWITIVRTFLP